MWKGISMKKSFREWFTQDYLMQSPLSSQLLNGNKSISDRQERICQIAELLMAREGDNIDILRQEIATKYFVTMRCSLDYINYATLFINIYKKRKV
jgi:hypothetical protein